MPCVRERRTVHGGHNDECDVADHDDADGSEGCVAVGFRGENLEVETEDGEFGEGGRGEVDVSFDNGVL